MQHYKPKEIIFQRDQQSAEHLHFNDKELAQAQQLSRQQNHYHSSTSKAHGGPLAKPANVNVGDLVFIKEEGSKFKDREQYVVTRIANNYAFLQKMNSGKFMSRQYKVPLTRIYPVIQSPPTVCRDWDKSDIRDHFSSDTDTDDSIYNDDDNTEIVENGEILDNSENDSSDETERESEPEENIQQRPQRLRKKPPYLADYSM